MGKNIFKNTKTWIVFYRESADVFVAYASSSGDWFSVHCLLCSGFVLCFRFCSSASLGLQKGKQSFLLHLQLQTFGVRDLKVNFVCPVVPPVSQSNGTRSCLSGVSRRIQIFTFWCYIPELIE